MTWEATWHADHEVLAGYAAGTLSRARTASVEAHLLTCGTCRSAIAPLTAPDRLEHNLAAITERVDQPRPHLIERLLQRLGVPDRIGRVLTVTPSARGAWLAAVLAAFAVAVIVDLNQESERVAFAFLVVAPLLPLAGMTAAFSTRGDPARELVLAAPTPGFDVLLMRSLAVLAPAIGLAAVAAAFVPDRGWEPVLWLLPAFGLTAATLALGTWFPVRWVAWALGAAWVGVAAISVRGAPGTEMVESFAAFDLAGQLALAAVAVVATVVVVVRRDAFDSFDIRRAS